MIYFWSDTHFGHANVIKFCRRPYADVDSMNEGLIQRWNHKVRPSDTIYVVGDFAFNKTASRVFDRLNGHKHLVKGNHDEHNPDVTKQPWESISDILTVRDNGRKIIACHYPMETWKNAGKGYMHVHGHSHGSLKRTIPHRLDVGCDVWQYPLSFDFLWDLFSKQDFRPQDHHGD